MFEFDCGVNAKIFDHIFAYYDLDIKKGESSKFFGEITIKNNWLLLVTSIIFYSYYTIVYIK